MLWRSVRSLIAPGVLSGMGPGARHTLCGACVGAGAWMGRVGGASSGLAGSPRPDQEDRPHPRHPDRGGAPHCLSLGCALCGSGVEEAEHAHVCAHMWPLSHALLLLLHAFARKGSVRVCLYEPRAFSLCCTTASRAAARSSVRVICHRGHSSLTKSSRCSPLAPQVPRRRRWAMPDYFLRPSETAAPMRAAAIAGNCGRVRHTALRLPAGRAIAASRRRRLLLSPRPRSASRTPCLPYTDCRTAGSYGFLEYRVPPWHDLHRCTPLAHQALGSRFASSKTRCG